MLKIEGLSKTYDNGVKALNNVNLEIPKGSMAYWDQTAQESLH